jgi:hypothetical protein
MSIPLAISFEDNFETQLASKVVQMGYKATKAREGTKFSSDTVDVLFELGEALTDDERIINDHTTEYLSYTGTVSLVVVSHRARKTIKHADILKRMRWLMMNRNKPLDSQYYVVHDIRAMGSQYSQDTESNLDITVLSYSVIFSIKSL